MKHIFYFLIFIGTSAFAQDTLQTVQLRATKKALRKSYRSVTNTATMTSTELLKAACCNLAESFETNPSIDVNFPDAVSGTKQIKMLGLTSPYLLITEENIPSVRGASQTYGLSFTPGTWVESIQVTKGAGPVVNGFESISGQINAELLKPEKGDPFFVNLYGSTDSRFEANLQAARRISEKWATSLFLHTNARLSKNDMNDDGFLDGPIGRQINLMNRWQLNDNENGWVSFITLRYLDDEKQAGETAFEPDRDKFTTNHWGSEINTRRADVSAKLGYVFPDMPYQSIGFQNALSLHDQDSYFGLNRYGIKQASYYANLIFNSIISNTLNKFSTGASFTYDRYDESVFVPGIDRDFDRADNSAGAFFEYTYDNTRNFSFVAGGRFDIHNRLGAFVTPRLHVRYNPWEKGVVRFSAGRGKRAANIFAENQQYFASSRTFSVQDAGGKLYGLNPEIAWNYGVSFMQGFLLFGKTADLTLDFYRTDFSRQVVVDAMTDAHAVSFYDLNGRSMANSFQAEFNVELKKHFNLRSAYKYYDIKTDYQSGTYERPLQARHRLFANLAYETHIVEHGRQWKFDATWNWLGAQRLPTTAGNDPADRLPDFSSPFSVVNLQATRTFSSVFEMYAGGENVLNYRQQKAVLGSDDPFGASFDTSIVYAPVFGAMYYVGLRWKMK